MNKWINWLKSGVEAQLFSGASLALIKNDQKPIFISEGTYPGELEAILPVHSQTQFDCASVTKSIPTGLLALQTMEKKLLSLNTKIADILPLEMSHKNEITLFHLLTHTLDYRISMSSLKNLSNDEIWQKLFTFEFTKVPGESYLYCNASSMLLGAVLEKIWLKPLERLADELLFTPLGMNHTGFISNRSDCDLELIVPTEVCHWRGSEIRGQVHDESAFAMLPQALGSAGLFSCTQDLAAVIQSLLNRDQKILQNSTLDLINQNWIPQLDLSTTLGFEYNNPRWMSPKLTQALGKTGFTGSSILFDLELNVGMVLLTNWTWPTRKKNLEPIFEFRKQGSELLAEGL